MSLPEGELEPRGLMFMRSKFVSAAYTKAWIPYSWDTLVAFNVGCSNSPGVTGAELSEMEQVQEKNSAHTDTLPGEL